MHDIKAIRENPDLYKRLLARKKAGSERLSTVLEYDEERRGLVTELNQVQTDLNKISKQIPKLPKEEQGPLKQKARILSAKVKEFKGYVAASTDALNKALMEIPNAPVFGVPKGDGPEDNICVDTWGEKPDFDFELKDHLALAEELDILDFERGAKITGSGFPVWKKAGAKLERALISYMLDTHTANGYDEILPPLLVNRASAEGTGQLPKSQDEMYYVGEDDLYLIPTAEVPVTNLHRNEILEWNDLPLWYAAYSPCFRREAGGHGAKTRGFLRVHQFNKVELVRITYGDLISSEPALEEIRKDAERVIRGLGLHYRVLELCDKDLSFAAAKCYDLEVWAPAEGRYLEASSCSNFLDFQARRMNLRYRDLNGKVRHCHTLNGSGLATSRILVALLETYQTAEGHIRIPEVLKPYMGVDLIV
jgi:seryl-tRNA synthetase